MIINTISSNDVSNRGLVFLYPLEIHFTNYVQVFQIPDLDQAAFISVSRTVIGTICTVIASALLGYLFTRPMWGRKFWYRYVVITMYFNAGLIAYYLTIMNLGLLNNFLVYIIPGIVVPFNIILVKTFVESMPSSIHESAEIDGATPFAIFVKIILPLSKPILATIAIWSAVGQWNAFMDAVLFNTRSDLVPLQLILFRFINQSNILARIITGSGGMMAEYAAQLATRQTPMSVRMTVTVIITLPILFVYPFFQRYFVKGLMIGAVKG
jgi:putative aldouronate transport system permease protein